MPTCLWKLKGIEMKAATWFWNEHEKRVRAGWRVLLQMALTAGLAYG